MLDQLVPPLADFASTLVSYLKLAPSDGWASLNAARKRRASEATTPEHASSGSLVGSYNEPNSKIVSSISIEIALKDQLTPDAVSTRSGRHGGRARPAVPLCSRDSSSDSIILL
jgi:hypothetical protein